VKKKSEKKTKTLPGKKMEKKKNQTIASKNYGHGF